MAKIKNFFLMLNISYLNFQIKLLSFVLLLRNDATNFFSTAEHLKYVLDKIDFWFELRLSWLLGNPDRQRFLFQMIRLMAIFILAFQFMIFPLFQINGYSDLLAFISIVLALLKVRDIARFLIEFQDDLSSK